MKQSTKTLALSLAAAGAIVTGTLLLVQPAPAPPVQLVSIVGTEATLRISPVGETDRWEVIGGAYCVCAVNTHWTRDVASADGKSATIVYDFRGSTANKQQVMVVAIEHSEDGKSDVRRVTIQPQIALMELPRETHGQ